MNTNVPTVGILNQETRSTTEPLAGMTPTMTPCVLQNSFRHATAYSYLTLHQRCNGNGVEYGVSRGMLKTISMWTQHRRCHVTFHARTFSDGAHYFYHWPDGLDRRTRRTLPQPRLERSFDGTNVRSYSCTYARHCVVVLIIYIYLAQYFFPYFSILLDFIFSCATQTLFCFIYPLPMFQHADRTALFQRFSAVCFLGLIISSWIYILEPSTG